MTTLEIHPDMLALLKAMDAKWLHCAPDNGFWHQPDSKTAVIGWLDLPRQTELPDAITEILADNPGINRIVTFAPENSLSSRDYSGLTVHVGPQFISAAKPIGNESDDFYGIRFCEQIRDVKSAEYAIDVAKGFSVGLKEEPFFSALNGSRFIVAYEEKSTVCGTVFVHGVIQNKCWMRRLFLQPHSRGKGLPKNIMKAALFLAEDRGFQVASILVARRIWDKGWLDDLGFVPEITVNHITMGRA